MSGVAPDPEGEGDAHHVVKKEELSFDDMGVLSFL